MRVVHANFVRNFRHMLYFL